MAGRKAGWGSAGLQIVDLATLAKEECQSLGLVERDAELGAIYPAKNS